MADLGDARDEDPESLGSGVSFWLPTYCSAKDDQGIELPVSNFVADSLNQDLNRVGYSSTLATKGLNRMAHAPLTLPEATAAAKAAGADYLITTQLLVGKTHWWGFLLIPFFQPVWTSIEMEIGITEMKGTAEMVTFHVANKDTEWNFGKVLILDSVFDAAIFARRWERRAWGRTVVPDALADAVIGIADELNTPGTPRPAAEQATQP